MTIQKAIKSGRPFRPIPWGKKWPREWYVYPYHKRRPEKGLFAIDELLIALTKQGASEMLRVLRADNWETKP